MNIPSGKLNPQKDAEIFRCYKRMLVSSTIFTTYIPVGLARNEKYENTRYQPTGIWIFHYFHDTSILWFISSLKMRIWSFPTVLMGMWVAASFSHGWPWLSFSVRVSHGDDKLGTLDFRNLQLACWCGKKHQGLHPGVTIFSISLRHTMLESAIGKINYWLNIT